MKLLKAVSKWLDIICGAIIVALVAGMVIVTVAQILCRVFAGIISFVHPLSWSEEVARFMLVWSTFLGATCVYRHGGNIAITAVQGLLPAGGRKVMRVLVHVICLILFVTLAYYGFQFCGKQVRNAAAVPIKMSTIYMVIPVSMVICAYHALVMALEEITAKEVKG